MLTISRRNGEGFWIGNDIFIRINRARGATGVSLSVHAPGQTIQREEFVRFRPTDLAAAEDHPQPGEPTAPAA